MDADHIVRMEAMNSKSLAFENESMMQALMSNLGNEFRNYASFFGKDNEKLKVSPDITDWISIEVYAWNKTLVVKPDKSAGILYFAFTSEVFASLEPNSSKVYKFGSIKLTNDKGHFKINRLDGSPSAVLDDLGISAHLKATSFVISSMKELLFGSR